MAKAELLIIYLSSDCGERGAARAVKYEHIYLNAYPNGLALERGLAEYFSFL
jgi:hypothetical protein